MLTAVQVTGFNFCDTNWLQFEPKLLLDVQFTCNICATEQLNNIPIHEIQVIICGLDQTMALPLCTNTTSIATCPAQSHSWCKFMFPCYRKCWECSPSAQIHSPNFLNRFCLISCSCSKDV